MMTFTHFLPLMIGDLVPNHDATWVFIINLIDIIDIILSYKITKVMLIRLRSLITVHHQSYILLFKDTLKPKHHFMTHYFSIISMSGAPRNYWTFRFEGKHKEFKMYSRAIRFISQKISIRFRSLFNFE